MTNEANEYLKKQERDKKWAHDENILVEYFLNQENTPPDIFINLILKYSGYILTCSNRGHGFSMFLISKKDIAENKKLRVINIGDDILLPIQIAHETAQFNYYINDKGQICVDCGSYSEDIIPRVICSSMEKFIEEYCLLDKLYKRGVTDLSHFDVLNKDELSKYILSKYKKINEVSDKYSLWCQNQNIAIEIAPWLGSKDGFYITAYCKDKNISNKLFSELSEMKLIE